MAHIHNMETNEETQTKYYNILDSLAQCQVMVNHQSIEIFSQLFQQMSQQLSNQRKDIK
jgi:hypothetical protein